MGAGASWSGATIVGVITDDAEIGTWCLGLIFAEGLTFAELC